MCFVASVCPHGIIRLPLGGCLLNLIFKYCQKSAKEIQVSLNSDKNNGYFTRITVKSFYHIALSSS
jgi:hypothetical protein